MALDLRQLVGTVTVDGKDAEVFGSDEFIHEPRVVDQVLVANQDTLIANVQRFTWGGECRVEIDMHAKLFPAGPPGVDGNRVEVWGQTRFYEGESVDTPEQEDAEDFFMTVPRGFFGSPPIVSQTDLFNPETVGQDDWARVTFSLRNRQVEEPPPG
ncbi:hypothetical protein HRW23_18285 [Streptomyces lunaelactis]|uniref:hypothetical protein n=1 Tax=Streptomyces lunaelactis TaxID=1535768 RepID=UPI0015859409|nr:hypothetical protein [Streptomyces lunaelactis]NUK04492.1 hypothetical protein [Streptomyces lunaelactis]NUK11052.1 hypothetical protein [Streptomyces lunaelactis]NUK19684.1 hypothetical protein [Streptomyces lunaelactis]NUK26967.1 hypothetical protein [Streptomyces lunaelactis]NUK37792.1 hypothetical protein [Streptomyces lunaelactis]